MIDRQALLTDLQKLLPKIEADLVERSESAEVPDVGQKLREEFSAAQAADRTAQNYEDWRSDAITQAAAAWVLSCVFVRFLEDNQLVPTPKIAGPGEGLKRARDEHELYFRSHPTQTDRDYLLAVFDGLTKYAVTKEVFGAHNPIRDLPNWLSGDAAGALITFLQRVDPNTGVLVHDFTDPDWDTRFLGDLYQDLSEAARKKYALLQTPVFVEEFILDRTLDPAIEEFGLARMGYETRLLPDGRLHPDDRFRMIDPACGSGHFLLGSFARLLERWRKREPGEKTIVLVQRALDSVHGVDLNPYAIAIARFRLLLAALKECGIARLSNAPGFAIHIACGDSLLHGSPGGDQLSLGWSSLDHVYQPEDRDELERLLRPKTYHAVVANPPYITPKDRALNQAYRDRYSTCHMKYSLAVPFLERIVSLAVVGGFTGQITANSFMKREFGRKLIEEFLPTVDITHVIDTQLAHVPGHGTPTVILLGRNRQPVSSNIRLVSAIKCQDEEPLDPAEGLVWSAILRQVDQSGSVSEFVSVTDSPRTLFHKHPWSIGGGGAAELKELLEEFCQEHLDTFVQSIGFASFPGCDDVFLLERSVLRRYRVPKAMIRPAVFGDNVRDWSIEEELEALAPYDRNHDPLLDVEDSEWGRYLWRFRTTLANVISFGAKTRLECGDHWWSWYRWVKEKYRTSLSIVFCEVATHTHFVLDRGGRAFKQTAPVVKLFPHATEEEYLEILGVLSTSTACFWLKQVCHCKGGSCTSGGIKAEAWERFYAFNGTKLLSFPLPKDRRSSLAYEIDELAQQLANSSPGRLIRHWRFKGDSAGTLRENLARAQGQWKATLQTMISYQEELDWLMYRAYGLVPETYTFESKPPPITLGQRAFEIVLARNLRNGALDNHWFERHHATHCTDLPSGWTESYRRLVKRRVAIIENDSNIRLIEQCEYKRRWNTGTWDSQIELALNAWLLDRLESYFDVDGRMNDESRPSARFPVALVSVGKLADVARQDPEFLQVGELYRDDPAFDVSRLVSELVEAESVPLLPILRYKPPGLRKREEWEKTWVLQRQEDAIDARTKLREDHRDYLTELEAQELKKKQVGTIPVPPKYTNADFLKSDYWRLRGKLDVPKERWVSFPHCPGEDGTLMIAWAGYDHLQLARAISAFYVDVQERLGGRDDPRLVPLLACIIELLPWLKQWHNDIDPEFGVPMGEYFEGFIQEEARQLGLTIDELRAWQPARKSPGRRGRGSR